VRRLVASTVSLALVGLAGWLFLGLQSAMPKRAFGLLLGLVAALGFLQVVVRRLVKHRENPRLLEAFDWVFAGLLALAVYGFARWIYPGTSL